MPMMLGIRIRSTVTHGASVKGLQEASARQLRRHPVMNPRFVHAIEAEQKV